jgi:hypothetical protein
MVIFFNGKNPTLTFSEIRAVRSLRIAGECSAREVCFIFCKPNKAKPANDAPQKDLKVNNFEF